MLSVTIGMHGCRAAYLHDQDAPWHGKVGAGPGGGTLFVLGSSIVVACGSCRQPLEQDSQPRP